MRMPLQQVRRAGRRRVGVGGGVPRGVSFSSQRRGQRRGGDHPYRGGSVICRLKRIHLRRIAMKRALIMGVALAALVALPAPDWAQGKTDFSGSWPFDPSKSDAAAATGRRGGGGGRMGGGGPAASMTVTQTPTQI